jgi:hypothetical protein
VRRPRWITRRRLVVVLLVAVTAVAITGVLGATRLLGHKSNSQRDAVAAYITSVDGVQQQMRLQLTRLGSAYSGFSARGTSSATMAKVAAAEQTLRTLEARIAALPAPADATRLRALLLQLVRKEVAVARELVGLGRFLPRFSALVSSVAAASAKLGRDLAATAPPKPSTVRGTAKQIAAARAAYAAEATKAAAAQADAVDAYDRAVGQVLRKLRTLQAPLVLAPAYRAEVRSLEATVAAGEALAAELRKPNRSQVPKLSRALTVAARSSASVAAQRSEIAAVKEYNTSVREIGKVSVRVQTETGRLQRELG